MKTYKMYRVSESGRKTLLNSDVLAENIGTVIADDISRRFYQALGYKSIGNEIVAGMKEDNMPAWEYYPEDVGVPTYLIVDPTVRRPKKKPVTIALDDIEHTLRRTSIPTTSIAEILAILQNTK